jgi:hypothetical protein
MPRIDTGLTTAHLALHLTPDVNPVNEGTDNDSTWVRV